MAQIIFIIIAGGLGCLLGNYIGYGNGYNNGRGDGYRAGFDSYHPVTEQNKREWCVMYGLPNKLDGSLEDSFNAKVTACNMQWPN